MIIYCLLFDFSFSFFHSLVRMPLILKFRRGLCCQKVHLLESKMVIFPIFENCINTVQKLRLVRSQVASCPQCPRSFDLESFKFKSRLQWTELCFSILLSSWLIMNFPPQLYILTAGQCIYSGSLEKLLPYMETQSLLCPKYHNPADFSKSS